MTVQKFRHGLAYLTPAVMIGLQIWNSANTTMANHNAHVANEIASAAANTAKGALGHSEHTRDMVHGEDERLLRVGTIQQMHSAILYAQP